jgi:hypothetical protein
LFRLSLVIGTRVTLGLAALVLPGLWLQARYAFAPLLATPALDGPVSAQLSASAAETRGATARLLLVACVAIILSAVGQSAIAALAEAMNTITPAGQVNGRTVFQLNPFSHAVTTVAAHLCGAGAVTFQAICVSVLFDAARTDQTSFSEFALRGLSVR